VRHGLRGMYAAESVSLNSYSGYEMAAKRMPGGNVNHLQYMRVNTIISILLGISYISILKIRLLK